MPPASTDVPPVSFDQIAASSDAHWGAGDGSDVANYEGDAAVWDAMFDYRPKIEVFTRLGDWCDFWRDPYWAVLRFNEERARILARRLKQEHRFLIYVLGNHDWVDAAQLARDLASFGFDSEVLNVVKGGIDVGGWHLEHGHRFDAFCNPKSPLYYVGKGATMFWGALSDLLHGRVDDDRVNPRKMFSARERGPRALAAVKQKAAQWAIKNGVHLCYGHTHELDFFHDDFRGYSVVNTGCCSKQRAAWALLLSNGEAKPFPIQGVF